MQLVTLSLSKGPVTITRMSGIIPPGKPGSGKPRRLPYSVANFEQILEEDYYLVDKTGFIRELENYRVPVFLRPRRFGKTLWCSTLECYYDIRRKEKFEELFGHLDIGRKPTAERNSYMVLRLNFSTVQVSMDMAKLERNFASDCRISLESFLRLQRHKARRHHRSSGRRRGPAAALQGRHPFDLSPVRDPLRGLRGGGEHRV